MGKGVRLVDSAEQTAKAVRQELERMNLRNETEKSGSRRFFVSDSPEKFKKLGERFLGKSIGKVNLVDINSY